VLRLDAKEVNGRYLLLLQLLIWLSLQAFSFDRPYFSTVSYVVDIESNFVLTVSKV